MEPRERKAGAGAILLLPALALVIRGASTPDPSANEDIVRAGFYAAASIIVGMAVLVWASG